MTTDNNTAAPALGMATSGPMPVRSHGRAAEPHAHRAVGTPRVVSLPRSSQATPTPSSEAQTGETLPRDHFLAQLRREKRRADRSKSPLSLVIYRLAKSNESESTASLRDLLMSSKRETDMLGQLGHGVLAVICPETGDEGIHRFIAKIDALSDDLPYSVESATYPDHLFEGLTASPTAAHAPSPLLHESQSATRDTYFLKRPIDIVGALLALVLFSPLMLVTALAVKLSSRGPVIFRQTRLGKAGAPFVFYKFRSMTVNGDDGIHREFVKNLIKGENDKVNQQDAANPLYKIKIDPRVTWVGRFIRKTSIDELPQLFNVLKGDMSLVGPRPPLPYEAENYKSWHLRRVLDIKPGMTGLWQVEGRSKVSFDEMVRMDLRYIRGCSLALDLRILVKTVLVVLKCEGAG
jgi:lipopolysaccharide/colanic/teichoic acid biosynthesis glycosyltransferase